MSEPPSLAGRAALAVALMIGFYVLALTIAAVLLFIPYAMVVYGHRVQIKIAAFCIMGALGILWSILPRFDRFVPPGPRLDPTRHPRLFAEIRRVAQAVGQPMPSEVYLVGDVNAWVARRGGLMGIGSRPVMGIGLPLLQVLTVTPLRAVLAHEFGHHHGGDTRLGPWIYKTRAAIGRTLASLGDSVLQVPFQMYGAAFLRLSHAVSRRQELSADALAARLIGAAPLIEGLKATNGAAVAFQAYWSSELEPVLQAGFRPPIAEGFSRFLAVPRMAGLLQEQIDLTMREEKGDPYDTHPPLRERVQALSGLPAGTVPPGDPAALHLLDDVADLERELLARVGGDPGATLRPVAWDDVAAQVYLPLWQRHCRLHGEGLGGITPGTLARWVAGEAAPAQERLRKKHHLSEGQARAMLGHTLGAALSLCFADAGWKVSTAPGEPVRLVKGALAVLPFDVLDGLASGRLTSEEWQAQCTDIADVPLVARG